MNAEDKVIFALVSVVGAVIGSLQGLWLSSRVLSPLAAGKLLGSAIPVLCLAFVMLSWLCKEDGKREDSIGKRVGNTARALIFALISFPVAIGFFAATCAILPSTMLNILLTNYAVFYFVFCFALCAAMLAVHFAIKNIILPLASYGIEPIIKEKDASYLVAWTCMSALIGGCLGLTANAIFLGVGSPLVGAAIGAIAPTLALLALDYVAIPLTKKVVEEVVEKVNEYIILPVIEWVSLRKKEA